MLKIIPAILLALNFSAEISDEKAHKGEILFVTSEIQGVRFDYSLERRIIVIKKSIVGSGAKKKTLTDDDIRKTTHGSFYCGDEGILKDSYYMESPSITKDPIENGIIDSHVNFCIQNSELFYGFKFPYTRTLRIPFFRDEKSAKAFKASDDYAFFLDSTDEYYLPEAKFLRKSGVSRPLKITWLPGKSLCLDNKELRLLLANLLLDTTPRDAQWLVKAGILPDMISEDRLMPPRGGLPPLPSWEAMQPLDRVAQAKYETFFAPHLEKLVKARDTSEAWERPYFALAELNGRRLRDTFKMREDKTLAEACDAEYAQQIAALGKGPLARHAWMHRLDLWLSLGDATRADQLFAHFGPEQGQEFVPFWAMLYEGNRDYCRYPGFQSLQELIYGPRTCHRSYLKSRREFGDLILKRVLERGGDPRLAELYWKDDKVAPKSEGLR